MKHANPVKYICRAEDIERSFRTALFASILLLGLAGLIHSPLSIARDDSSMSGQSGQSSSMSDQTSSGQSGSQGGHKGHHKKHGASTQGQSGSSTSGMPEEKRTGVTGDTPSGQHSETSGQKRGPGGY